MQTEASTQLVDEIEQPSRCRSLVHGNSLSWPVPGYNKTLASSNESASSTAGGASAVAFRTNLATLKANAIPRWEHLSFDLPRYEPAMQGYHAGPRTLENSSS